MRNIQRRQKTSCGRGKKHDNKLLFKVAGGGKQAPD